MAIASAFAFSKVMTPLGSSVSQKQSLGPFNKQIPGKLSINSGHQQRGLLLPRNLLKLSLSGNSSCKGPSYFNPLAKQSQYRQPINCSYSNATTSAEQNPSKKLSFESLRQTLSRLTPIDICKCCLIFSVSVAAAKWSFNFVSNPFVWMYFSWTWLFWPWFVAIALAIYGIYSFSKHLRGEANVVEQLAIVTSTVTWLTLVPPAHFNGFLEGWPFVFFFVYHYFFFYNVSIRKRLYGDLYPREHDPKWDVNPPNWQRLLFCAGVVVAHWLAAFEGSELHLVPGGWNNLWIWASIILTLFSHYDATLYLSNYSEKVVVPTAVVQFGPYRWVRHPIYASTMFLFTTYFAALRAPFSLLFVVVICLAYYEQKAKLEEALMVGAFGERYTEYMGKVQYKFVPFIF